MNKKHLLSAAITTILAVPSLAYATNAMNMNGYGAISAAMGGTGIAHDVGHGALLGNPATVGMNHDGSEFEFTLGILGPDVVSSAPNGAGGIQKTESDGTSYLMPIISYNADIDNLTIGAGVISQGGMGTEYGFAGPSDLFAGGRAITLATGALSNTPLSGEEIRSELGVGRLVLPVSFRVNNELTVGASLDYLFATMDLQMDLDGATFASILQGVGGSASNTMFNLLAGQLGTGIQSLNWARFDYSDDSDFSGAAKGAGWGGKLGFTFKINDQFTIGAHYHSEVSIDDFDTGSAKMKMCINGAAAPTCTTASGQLATVTGKMTVVDFKWPTQYGIGMAFKASDQLTVAADIKVINWSETMEKFKLNFAADATQTDPIANAFGIAGTILDVALDLNWDDMTVINLGAAYKVSDELTVRAGASFSSNPVPDSTLNPLFPAIIENNYTLGAGLKFDEHTLDASLEIAPDVEQTAVDKKGARGITSSHSQLNWQFQYGYHF